MTQEKTSAGDLRPEDELVLDLERRRRRLRWWSLVAGLMLAAGVAIGVFHFAVRDANGAPSEDGGSAGAASSGTEEEGEDGKDEPGEEKAPIPVEVAVAERGAIAAYLSATANLVAEEQVTVVSEVEGRVASLAVEEGDWVGRGEVLAVLDREDERIAVAKAEARFANASAAWERGEDLFAKELLSRESHDKLRADHEVASQELAEARWQLERNTFRSPFAGRVTERRIQVGQHVSAGDELFQVTDSEPLIARIFLPETDVVTLSEGREVRITLNADPSVRFTGRIRQISPVVDTATGTVKITVEAVDPPAAVRSGSFVAIDIVRETRAAVILLPKQAVIRELQASHVFIIDGDKAVRRSVRLGLEEGERVEAVEGVAAGERVVVAGQGGLKDGQEIRVLGDEPAAS